MPASAASAAAPMMLNSASSTGCTPSCSSSELPFGDSAACAATTVMVRRGARRRRRSSATDPRDNSSSVLRAWRTGVHCREHRVVARRRSKINLFGRILSGAAETCPGGPSSSCCAEEAVQHGYSVGALRSITAQFRQWTCRCLDTDKGPPEHDHWYVHCCQETTSQRRSDPERTQYPRNLEDRLDNIAP